VIYGGSRDFTDNEGEGKRGKRERGREVGVKYSERERGSNRGIKKEKER